MPAPTTELEVRAAVHELLTGNGSPRLLCSRNYRYRMTAVYRLYDGAGRLLYVGVTYDFVARLRGHAKDKKWWPQVAHRDVIWFDNRLDALYEEARAIRYENPVHNSRPGVHPFGVVVIARRQFVIPDEGLPYHVWKPVRESLRIRQEDIFAVAEAAAYGRLHAIITYEAEPIGVLVTPDWYRQSCKVLDIPEHDLATAPVLDLEAALYTGPKCRT